VCRRKQSNPEGKLDEDLKARLARRDALFRNPNAADAMTWWNETMGTFPPHHPLVPMAACHKARLQWLDATDTMLEESKAWLAEHGFRADWQGAEPLTPEQRDAQRAALGKPPVLDLN
jgi:hypothetical protein